MFVAGNTLLYVRKSNSVVLGSLRSRVESSRSSFVGPRSFVCFPAENVSAYPLPLPVIRNKRASIYTPQRTRSSFILKNSKNAEVDIVIQMRVDDRV